MMALPNPFSSGQTEASRYLTIALSDTKIQALFWHVANQQPELVQHSSVRQYSSVEEVVVEADKVLQELGKESEHVNDVIFALEPSWVNATDVEVAYKPILKRLSEELSLNPVGYVVFSESLVKELLADQPHSSLLFVYFTQHEVFIQLLYRGSVAATQRVGRSDNSAADVIEALARITQENSTVSLPSHMILASQELEQAQLQEEQQALLAQDWTQQGFTHPPTIDIFAKDRLLAAVVKQAGAAIIDSVTDVQPTKASSFGVPIPVAPPTAHDENDYAVVTPTANLATHPVAERPTFSAGDDEEDEAPMKRDRFTGVKSWFRQHHKFVLMGFGGGLLALFLLAFVGLSVGTKAYVKVDLKTKPLSKEVDITIDPDSSSSDPEKLILAAQTVEKEVSGSKTAQTTGVKLVGEKAAGTVTIFNKTEAVKTFEAGTVVSKGALTFTLDETIQIASASVKKNTTSESKDYGKADVKVTATKIGSDYNLGEKTEMVIASFDTDTYSAAVATALAGGTSREVRVVSDGDRQKLLTELKQELIEKAGKELAESAADGVSIVPTQTAKVSSTKFDAEIGDEIGALTLDLTITAKALSYADADLQPLAQHVLQADIPGGYKLSENKPQLLTSADKTASGSGAAVLKANVSSTAVPDLSIDELLGSIAGKSLLEAEQSLKAREVVEGVTIQLTPSVSHQLRPRVPKDPAKIQLEFIQ
jgi:hypothetical protein